MQKLFRNECGMKIIKVKQKFKKDGWQQDSLKTKIRNDGADKFN